jgi:hypothetical protein
MTLILNGTDNSATTPAVTGTDTDTGIYYPTSNQVAIATNGTQAMLVDASQNVGIGMTPTNFGNGYTVLQVANASNGGMLYLTNTANAGGRIYGNGAGITYDAFSTTYHAFTTNGAERMRIDSSGTLLVGATSSAGHILSKNPGDSQYATSVVNSKTDNTTVTNGFLVKYTGVSPTDGNYMFLCQDSTNTNRFYVTNAGGTGGTSDANLKKNIETTRDGYAEDLCKIRIVKYNWKEQPEGTPKDLGWIAQEVEQVFPRMVKTDEDTGIKSVTYSAFVPMLIKAIQELKAEFDAYKASHP